MADGFSFFKHRTKIRFASLYYFNILNFLSKVTSYNENLREEGERLSNAEEIT